ARARRPWRNSSRCPCSLPRAAGAAIRSVKNSMTDLFFVDSNVFVYARDPSEPEKQSIAEQWVRRLWRERRGRISAQVLLEFYTISTRKLQPPVPRPLAQAYVRSLLDWPIQVVTFAVIEQAWRLESAHRLSFWDAVIASAAHAQNCRYLLSEDMRH